MSLLKQYRQHFETVKCLKIILLSKKCVLCNFIKSIFENCAFINCKQCDDLLKKIRKFVKVVFVPYGL